MNLGDLVAIDVHTHAEVSASGQGSLGVELERASARYFRAEVGRRPTLEQIAGYYRQRRLACVVFPVDAEAASGIAPVPTRRSPRPPGRTLMC